MKLFLGKQVKKEIGIGKEISSFSNLGSDSVEYYSKKLLFSKAICVLHFARNFFLHRLLLGWRVVSAHVSKQRGHPYGIDQKSE